MEKVNSFADIPTLTEYKRGEIYYINRVGTEVGSEQYAGRPAIIVSNDAANRNSNVLEVVYLTTQEKKPLPTHVIINSAQSTSTALCEAVYSVDVSRIGDKCGICTPTEIEAINNALMISLGLIPKINKTYRKIIDFLLDELN